MFICAFIITFFVFQSFALYVNQDLPWDRLQVTWGSFNTLPYTSAEAKNSGWTSISTCNDKANWPGNMFIYGDDVSIVIIYDVNGNLAGIQFGVVIPPTTPNIPPWQQVNSSYWVLTFYIVDPTTICSSKHIRKFSGAGDRLVLQNGNNINNLISFPLSESDISNPWVNGRCFYTMGKHYWYNISSTMDCNYFFPVFLMYNGGILNAFGPDIGTAPVTSPRWEHPTGNELGWFFNDDTLPQCLYKEADLSTMHVYFTSGYFNFC